MLSRAYEHTLNSSTVPVGQPVLQIKDLELRFGGVVALHNVGFTVSQGHIHSVIGPNGAGKSSLLNCVSGLYHPQKGQVTLHTGGSEGTIAASHELTAIPPHRIARLGVARSFQNIELFSQLTVLENLMLGRHTRMRQGILSSLVWFGPARVSSGDFAIANADGWADDALSAGGALDGATAFLQKPFRVSALGSKVAEVLRSARGPAAGA